MTLGSLLWTSEYVGSIVLHTANMYVQIQNFLLYHKMSINFSKPEHILIVQSHKIKTNECNDYITFW